MSSRHSLIFTLGRPLGPIYGLIMRTRNTAYRNGILRTKRLPCPVISIGNITLGGTGKTPHVIALARWLTARGIKPGIISRGYGGKAGKGPLVVSDGKKIVARTTQAGDEPVMMADILGNVPIVVGSDRYNAALQAISRFGTRIIILDDGFQHLRIYRDMDIILMPAASPTGNSRIFPGGNLREPLTSVSRAHAILLTRSEQLHPSDLAIQRKGIQGITKDRPVFTSKTVICGLKDQRGKRLPVTTTEGMRIFAFCGLGDPDTFWHTLNRLKTLEVVRTRAFKDHFSYRVPVMEDLFREALEAGADALITTSKDHVKVLDLLGSSPHKRSQLPILSLEIDVQIEQGFWRLLDNMPFMKKLPCDPPIRSSTTGYVSS